MSIALQKVNRSPEIHSKRHRDMDAFTKVNMIGAYGVDRSSTIRPYRMRMGLVDEEEKVTPYRLGEKEETGCRGDDRNLFRDERRRPGRPSR